MRRAPPGAKALVVELPYRFGADLGDGGAGTGGGSAVQAVPVEFGDGGETRDGRRIVRLAFDLVDALAADAFDFVLRKLGIEDGGGEELERLVKHLRQEVHGDGADGVADRRAVADAQPVEPARHLHGVPAGSAGGEEPGGEFAETAESGRFDARAALEDEVERHLGQPAPLGVLDAEAVGERVPLEAREREGARGGRRRAHGPVGRHGVPSSGTTWRTVRPRGSSTTRATRSTSGRPTAP